jgi:hypothetical protein
MGMLFFQQQQDSVGSSPSSGSGSAEEERQRRAYRAALLSVYLHTERATPWAPVARFLPPSMPQPMPIERAYEVIREQLTGEYKRLALHIATSRLVKVAPPAFFRHARVEIASLPEKRQTEAGLQALLGAEGVAALVEALQDLQGTRDKQVKRSSRTGRFAPRDVTAEGALPDWMADRAAWLLKEAPPTECLKRPSPSRAVMPISTLVTDIQVNSRVFLSYQTLTQQLDPRNWGRSPLWRAAHEVVPSEKGFTKRPPSSELGQPWDGMFYEHVEWNWNERSLAAFQCYLNISFRTDPVARSISLHFRLHSCQGSLLYSRLAQTGIDVDSGEQTAWLCKQEDAEVSPETPVWFSVDTRKALRYSDVLDRLTPHQGPPQAGALLNYLAPIVAGLWMSELVHGRLYAVEVDAGSGTRRTLGERRPPAEHPPLRTSVP